MPSEPVRLAVAEIFITPLGTGDSTIREYIRALLPIVEASGLTYQLTAMGTQVEGPVDRWREVRQRIHAEVCERGYDSERGTFVQSYGSKNLDASLLLIPTTGFLPATDARVRGTIEAVERHLFVDGFVRRYDTHATDDGLPAGEGAFLACSFWLVDALRLSGREADARQLFERLLGLRNDVGLLSEQYDTETKRLVGNFPQAFSHIALVNSAHNLSRTAKPAEQRSARNGDE